jgi:hypothetical protein
VAEARTDRLALLLTHGTLLALAAVALGCIAAYGRDIPLAEDWYLVGPLTGNGPDLVTWLWSQNNEHRLPLPRLLLLGVTAAAGGDFRAGMVLNVLTLAGLGLAMLWAARRLHGGRQRLEDVVIPLLLLHLGHWENLVWSWQFQFVCSVALTGLLLIGVVLATPDARGAGPIVALALALLPLAGANGLIVALPAALWLAIVGVGTLTGAWDRPPRRRSGLALLAAAALGLLLIGVYFVGWERPGWTVPPESPRQFLRALEFYLAYGFGPGARWLRHPAAILAFFLLASGVVLAARAAWRGPANERPRALGLLAFLASAGALALAIAWGRASSSWKMSERYALFSVMGLLCAWYTWQIYGEARQRRIVALGAVVTVLAVLPLNFRAGLDQRDVYVQHMAAVEADLAGGMSRRELARRHRSVLMHWDEQYLAEAMRQLRDARLGPFRALAD